MVRATVRPESTTVIVTLSVPDEYLGKEVEVIAFEKKEGLSASETVAAAEEEHSFTVLHVAPELQYKFNREDANER